jgi:hypothetical protein
MLGIRPDWPRTHRKGTAPGDGRLEGGDNASIFLSNKISFPSATLYPPPHVLLRAETGDLTAAMLGRARSSVAASPEARMIAAPWFPNS